MRRRTKRKSKSIIDYSKIPIENLRLSGLQERNVALSGLSMMKKGKSLTQVARELRRPRKLMLSHIKSALKKKNGRWVPKKSDSQIQRAMNIFEDGEIRPIVIGSDKYGSLIGKYHATVHKALDHRNPEVLQEFARKKLVDIHGRKHKFEVRWGKLFDIWSKMENPETFTIYVDSEEDWL